MKENVLEFQFHLNFILNLFLRVLSIGNFLLCFGAIIDNSTNVNKNQIIIAMYSNEFIMQFHRTCWKQWFVATHWNSSTGNSVRAIFGFGNFLYLLFCGRKRMRIDIIRSLRYKPQQLNHRLRLITLKKSINHSDSLKSNCFLNQT